jgi:predicted PurR-regulated permease PerM
LRGWAERTHASEFLGLAQSLGQFAVKHLLILLFTILLLFFLYDQGESLARDFRRWLRQGIGERAERHIDVVTRAVRACVNSMMALGLFDGVAIGLAYGAAGVPRAAVWGAIIGSIAIVPFLGYAVVAALALRIAIEGQAALAVVSLALGWGALLAGDKVVRPLVTRGGIHLPFVWILMACLGGFEVLGLVGLVIGPVVLALARELWDQRVRDLQRAQAAVAPSPNHSNESPSCKTRVPAITTCEPS